MDIKVKGITRAAVLVYDLDDSYSKNEMLLATKVSDVQSALQEFFSTLRSIRKYDNYPEVAGTTLTPKLKEAILQSEEYYRMLLLQRLEENDVSAFLE